MNKICLNCGTSFPRPTYTSPRQWVQRIFCSVACTTFKPKSHRSIIDRIESNYLPEPNSGCWLWTGYVANDGYGQIKINGERWKAHIMSFNIFRGGLSGGKMILHTCDIRCCINPDHLYEGDVRDNSRDMVNRGRSLAGEKHHRAKLQNHHIPLIRSAKGKYSEIGKLFGISRTVVGKIKTRKAWSSIP